MGQNFRGRLVRSWRKWPTPGSCREVPKRDGYPSECGTLHSFEFGINAVKNFIFIQELTAFGRMPTFLNLRSNLLASNRKGLVKLFETPETFPDHFAYRIVAAGLHPALNEMFKLWRESTFIEGPSDSDGTAAPKIVNV
jgi:hypothetical protein